MSHDQIEGRNPIVEALLRKRRRVLEVRLDARAKPDPKLKRMLRLCREQSVPVVQVQRRELDKLANGRVHNGVIARAEPLRAPSVAQLLKQLQADNIDPFLVMADELSYEHNLGAVMRSALGAGVHAVVVPHQRGKGLTPVVHRVSMGGAEAVPLIREGLSSALAQCKRAGLRIVGADMDGTPAWDLDLTGPLVLVLGGESKGLSPTLRKKCHDVAAVPLMGDLESLNVSVTGALLMFERVRQTRG